MDKQEQRILTIVAIVLGAVGLYCFLVLFMFRTDTTEDIYFKRNAAICFVFIWPFVFALSHVARVEASWLARRFGQWTALAIESLLILLLSWGIAALLMGFEYSRLINPEEFRGPFGI